MSETHWRATRVQRRVTAQLCYLQKVRTYLCPLHPSLSNWLKTNTMFK